MVKLSNLLVLPDTHDIKKEIEFDCDINSFQEAILYTTYITSRYDYCYDMLKQFNEYTKSLGYDLSILNQYAHLTVKLRGLTTDNFSDLFNEENKNFLDKLGRYIEEKRYTSEIFVGEYYNFLVGKAEISFFSIDFLDHIPYTQVEELLQRGIPLDENTINYIKLYKRY